MKKLFSENIKYIRAARGFSQADLAKKIGVAQQTVASWETGRREPDLSKFAEICNVLNVSADYLLGLSAAQQAFVEPEHTDLTAREIELIALYRQLPQEDQLILFGEIKGIVRARQQESAARIAP